MTATTSKGRTLPLGRIAGTAVLAVAVAMPYAMGLWWTWQTLLRHLIAPIGLLALIGAVLAPIQLVRDIVEADREDRADAEAGRSTTVETP